MKERKKLSVYDFETEAKVEGSYFNQLYYKCLYRGFYLYTYPKQPYLNNSGIDFYLQNLETLKKHKFNNSQEVEDFLLT